MRPNHKIVTRSISAKTTKKECKPHDLRVEHNFLLSILGLLTAVVDGPVVLLTA